MPPVTAVDLAQRLGVDPKTLREWLRMQAKSGHPVLQAHDHGDRWVFTREQANNLAMHFWRA
jgi:transposase-like protein